MIIGPTLETPRLILRPPVQEDIDAWAEIYGDGENLRFIGGAQPRDAAWRYMATMAGGWVLQGYAMFSVIEKESGNVIGRMGPWRPGGKDANWPGDEVGWILMPRAQGKGYAYEGSVAAMDWAFDNLGWDEIVHCITPQNDKAIALAERLGSRWLRQDRLPAPFEGLIQIYGQSKAEWRTHRT